MNATGWTGGQYTFFRYLFGAYLLAHFCAVLGSGLAAPNAVPTGIAVACSILFLLGLGDRVAALILAASGILLHNFWVPALPLLYHCFLPPAPYGSWASRLRTDPAGQWHIHRSVWLALLFALGGVYLVLVITLFTNYRLSGVIPGLLALHVLAFDPAWIPPFRADQPDRVFYDGSCGLCHRAVRFLIAEDRTGSAFRFAPLQSHTFFGLVFDEIRSQLPDSIVIVTAEGALLTRAKALIRVGRRLGGFWSLLAEVAAFLPLPALDRLYDAVARSRYRLFPKPEAVCPLLPDHLRARFDS
jgi:predicted DCC family thiol-disulfide oxidoreductase YuxK